MGKMFKLPAWTPDKQREQSEAERMLSTRRLRSRPRQDLHVTTTQQSVITANRQLLTYILPLSDYKIYKGRAILENVALHNLFILDAGKGCLYGAFLHGFVGWYFCTRIPVLETELLQYGCLNVCVSEYMLRILLKHASFTSNKW